MNFSCFMDARKPVFTILAVQQILARRRDEKRQPPPLAVAVPAKVKHYSVKPVSLAVYDKLNKAPQDD